MTQQAGLYDPFSGVSEFIRAKFQRAKRTNASRDAEDARAHFQSPTSGPVDHELRDAMTAIATGLLTSDEGDFLRLLWETSRRPGSAEYLADMISRKE